MYIIFASHGFLETFFQGFCKTVQLINRPEHAVVEMFEIH